MARWPEENFNLMIDIMKSSLSLCMFSFVMTGCSATSDVSGQKHSKGKKVTPTKASKKVTIFTTSSCLLSFPPHMLSSISLEAYLTRRCITSWLPFEIKNWMSRLLQPSLMKRRRCGNKSCIKQRGCSYVRLCYVSFVSDYLNVNFKIATPEHKRGRQTVCSWIS